MGLPNEFLVEMYRRMIRIRLFEDTTWERRTDVPGVTHLSTGMEASIVGACMALGDEDYMVGTHRSHGHPIGKGARLDRLAAELMGKVTGINRGKGGSMHLSDFSVGSLGETSIVGSGLPVATGAALGCKMQHSQRIALCFFGDGAANEGTFHESLNLAAIWALPVVYLCENNAYGELTAHADACAVTDIASRAAAYGMPGVVVDGQDVVAVYAAVSEAAARARAGDGPSLVETKTYRYNGHAGGPDETYVPVDPNLPPMPTYRPQSEVDEWRARDPVGNFRQVLVADGVLSAAEADALDAEERHNVDAAWQFGLDSDYPPSEAAYEHMFTNAISIRR
jgi:acetoin:2,6-dichlorophenolindophenol oxidoreductase subunit alpha